MVRLNWAILCEKSVVDSASNALSLLSVVEEVHPESPSKEVIAAAAGKPLMFAYSCAVVSHWRRDANDEDPNVILSLVGPKGEQYFEITEKLQFQGSTRTRLLANLPGLPAGPEGTYVWQFYLQTGQKRQLAGEIPYELSYIKSQADMNRLNQLAAKRARGMAKTRRLAAKTFQPHPARSTRKRRR